MSNVNAVRFESAAPYLVPTVPTTPARKPRASKAVKVSAEDAVIAQALAILETRLRKASDVFGSPDAVKAYCRLHLGALGHEEFGVLFLNAQNGLIEFQSMFRGTLTQTSVYPREVVKVALALGAAAVVLTHNHPSGTVQPSRADEALTQTLKAALALVDVRVLDHVIVSATGALSFAEKGLI